ncbi:MAG: 6-phosphofructokinase [Calditrichaeota bacterium]|nr:6-phosphofructokinase [Calditrichota bacterium]
MKRIAVMSSGGDAPGMNAFIRSVIRSTINRGLEAYGIRRGYEGLIDNDIEQMDKRSVSNIIQRGGTILQTARCEEFKTKKGLRQAIRNLNSHGIDGLVALGGDGSLAGALSLHEAGFPVIGAPGTIDNDLAGTDMAIGVDTALNTVLDAVDKIKETASSHQRAFIVEVMGRNCGYIALISGIIGGAEMICIPEKPFGLMDVVHIVEKAYVSGKTHCIIIVAEGAKHSTRAIKKTLDERIEEAGFETRVTILGHIQRGGSPTAFDRLLATRLGAAAVDHLIRGESGKMVGLVGNKITTTPLKEIIDNRRELDMSLYDLARSLEF